MRKAIIIFISLFVFSPLILAADNNYNPVENEFIEYLQKSAFGRIVGGRQAVLGKLKSNDPKAAREIYNFLDKSIDKTIYAPFYIQEMFQLCVLSENYEVLKDTAALEGFMGTDKDWGEGRVALPPNDGLYQELRKMLKERKTALIEKGRQELTEEEAGFQEILIATLLKDDFYKNQEEINIAAEALLKKYPSSKYREFIKKNIWIAYKMMEKGWGVSLGMGKLYLAGNLNSYFANNLVLDMSLDFYNKRMLYDFGFTIGIADETKESFTHRNEFWAKGTSTVLSTIGLQTGYKIDLAKKMNIYPLLGVEYFSFYPGQDEVDNNRDHTDIFAWALTYGFAWDINLTEKMPKPPYYWNPQATRTKLRLKFTASNPRFSEQLNGVIYRIVLIYNFNFWQLEREVQ